MMSSFKDKVVIVTGGSSGIGLSTAIQFANLGASVLITGRRADALVEAARQHPNIEGVIADVSKPEDASRRFPKLSKGGGRAMGG
jgi:NAD(P)-dependent dehydrogenase (short-subunit alcohol dehydrogenase family)